MKVEVGELLRRDPVCGLVPCGRRSMVKVTVGRLVLAGGFWMFSLHKLPTFFWWKQPDSVNGRGGQVRVWRVLVGLCWRRTA